MNFPAKKLSGILIYLVIVVITLEVSPFILSPFISGQAFSRKRITSELMQKEDIALVQTAPESKPEQNEYLGDHILHPYLGFVSIPHDTYNEFRFPGPNPVLKRSPGNLNVVIMGGSVAKDLFTYAGERIKQNLKSIENYNDKQVNLVVFALGGFKQPQQLIALNYFMALGAEYDMVINIDGFNETVLPYSDNLPFHVFPSYPRHWNVYARKKLDAKLILLLGKQAVIKEKQQKCLILMAQSMLRYSNFRLFLWKVMNNRKTNQMAVLEAEIRETAENSATDYQSTGIYTTVTDTLAFFKEQAAFWRRSSEQIAQLGKSAGFDYYHFLQPNQYVEGSKNLTREEMEIAYENGPFPYKYAVQKGYPQLIAEGEILKNKNINFTDLTLLFTDEKRSVYSDKCCHFNQLGYDLIADKITEVIISGHNRGK